MKNTLYPRMHVSLYVSDLKKTIDFYNLFFQQSPEKVKPKYAKYILEKPSLIISFVENPDRVQRNFGHLGFQVEKLEEMNDQLKVARAHNIVSKEEIGTACCYALQDKFWVTDPDGVQWEVYYFHEDSDFNDPHYSMEDTSACCITEEKQTTNTVIEKVAVSVPLAIANAETCCDPGSACC